MDDGDGSRLRWIGPLTVPEQSLIERAAQGEALALPTGAAPTEDQTPVELEEMQAWGADRTIRAEMLRHLLVESEWPVQAKGVRLRGARISGPVDLESATLRCPLVLEDCYFDSERPLVLDYATVSLLRLVRCRFAGLTADTVVVTKELDLERSVVTGAVKLITADITGELNCRGAKITGTDTDGNALVANWVEVGGRVLLDEEFTAAGAIRLIGADITGELNCRGAKITGTDINNNALVADRVKVGGAVFLDGEFTAAGAVRLVGAVITGYLTCSGAKITGTDTDGDALVADRVKVGDSLLLDDGFLACGAVRLVGAHIGGSITLDVAAIRDPSGKPGMLAIDGLVYEGLPSFPPPDEWLDVLRERTNEYSPQPYRQLAAASQAAGHDAFTRKVLIAQRRDQLSRTDMTWTEKTWGQITHITLGYGYQPWRALIGLLGVVILSVILSVSYGAQGGLVHTETSPSPGASCSTLERVGVGLDFAIPVVRSGAGGTCAATQTVAGNTVTVSGWVLQLAAWSLATLFIAGFTGAVRKT